jgi:hypothetical protein
MTHSNVAAAVKLISTIRAVFLAITQLLKGNASAIKASKFSCWTW